MLTKIRRIRERLGQISELLKRVDDLQKAVGRLELQFQSLPHQRISLREHEFKVYSQWGEDGIIQFLINHVKIDHNVFVEFGVEDYQESNTRFLLQNNYWSGLVIDGSPENISKIQADPIYFKHNLTAISAFVDKDNINNLLVKHGISGDIGLLSIDIDGNDYWVWQAINVIRPAIVIVEYNHRFGPDRSVTIPYDKYFVRSKAHHSMIYYGASLKALCNLGSKKGYTFVGTTRSGGNAFFVRKDLKDNKVEDLSVTEGFTAGLFRESRDVKGNLIFLSHEDEIKILSSLPIVNVD